MKCFPPKGDFAPHVSGCFPCHWWPSRVLIALFLWVKRRVELHSHVGQIFDISALHKNLLASRLEMITFPALICHMSKPASDSHAAHLLFCTWRSQPERLWNWHLADNFLDDARGGTQSIAFGWADSSVVETRSRWQAKHIGGSSKTGRSYLMKSLLSVWKCHWK